MNKLRDGFLAFVAALSLAAGAVIALPGTATPAAAFSGSDFNPGMIISDELFYDGNAMTASQIQTFLNGKIGTCQNARCLNVASVPVASREAAYSARTGQLICSALEGGTMLVSELIYRTQVACGISAKVILVTLQKEQGLVTNRAPGDRALRAAMGMGCPDTAPCDDAFAGLANQIFSGTKQLKTYKAGRFGRQPGTQYVQFNPNTACGGTNVAVSNYATAALYNYTPYQPNSAALANIGGVGDGCSSYGNRNFWAYYQNWFGSVAGGQFMSSTVDVDYLIARDANNELWGYPVSPSGGWGLRTSLGAGWGGVTDVIGVGDLDSNGYRDIIARDTAGKSWFYSGNGNLDYPTRTQLAADWSQASRLMYGGYIDAGPDPDMLTVDSAGDMWLWPGNGVGGFGAAVKTGSGFGAYSVVAGVGDITGDKCGDVVAIATAGALMLYAGNCTTGFAAPRQIGSGFGSFTGLYAASDFTADGKPDLWAKDASGTMRLFRGTGGGAIANTSIADSGWQSMQNISGAGMRPAYPAMVTTVSSTDDMFAGYLIARDRNNALWAYAANAQGTWREPRVSLGTGWAGVTDVIGVGDLDNNGYRDLIARDTAGKSWFYPGDGRLDYPVRSQINADWASARHILYGGYFDHDSFADMLTIDSAGDLWLWPGTGTGGFKTKVKVTGGLSGVIAVSGVGDFNGDRCGDILWISASGQLMLSVGDCAGAVTSSTQIGSGFSTYKGIYSTGDFTSDRIPDVWLMASDGSIRLFKGTGGGAVASTGVVDGGWGSFLGISGSGMRPGTVGPVPTPTPTPVPTAGQSGVGDINGDGMRDILGVTSSGALRAYYGNGAGGFSSDATIDYSWGTQGALTFAMGDFTGDGRPDIGSISTTGTFLIAKGNGSGFDRAVVLATGWGDLDVVVGAIDWDGDGKPDIMARSRSGQLWVYRGDGAGGWASPNGLLIGSGWSGYQPIGVGNFDGTGGDDVLARQSNGDLWLYRGDGAGGWASLNGTRVGSGWSSFVTVFSPGDFDGVPGTDILARSSDGRLFLYSGTGAGGLRAGVQIDSGWLTFRTIF